MWRLEILPGDCEAWATCDGSSLNPSLKKVIISMFLRQCPPPPPPHAPLGLPSSTKKSRSLVTFYNVWFLFFIVLRQWENMSDCHTCQARIPCLVRHQNRFGFILIAVPPIQSNLNLYLCCQSRAALDNIFFSYGSIAASCTRTGQRRRTILRPLRSSLNSSQWRQRTQCRFFISGSTWNNKVGKLMTVCQVLL